MSDNKFASLVQKVLLLIAEKIEQHDPEGNIDIELKDGILEIEHIMGKFVINKNSAAKEIWLSSPVSGPYHFAYRNGLWQNRKNIELFALLKSELNIKFS